MDGQARQAKRRHVVPSQPAPHNFRRPGVCDRCRTQAVEAENGFVVGVVDGKKRLGAAEIVTLAGMAAEELIQRFFAAVESFAIMAFGNRLFMPCHSIHDREGSPFATANSLAFGAGGFSSRSNTRKLSRSESWTRSAS